jgi:hypothetical protein
MKSRERGTLWPQGQQMHTQGTLIGPVLSNGFALYGIPLMNKAYEHVTFLWAYIFKGLFVSILT